MILKEDILSVVNEKQIMEFYWQECLIDNKPVYKNPMRDDSNGTCYFNWVGEKYIFVDRARGIDANFDCFTYVQWIYDCSFREALIRINDDMILKAVSKMLNLKQKQGGKKHIKKRKVQFKVNLRKWNNYDKQYWGQYNISLENVNKIAKPVKSYKSNAGSVTFKLKYQYDIEDPCYAYIFKNSNHLKLYRPYSKYSKWKSNVNVNDVFGYNQLPHFSDELYIVSGAKDMLCMWEMGFNAIASQSETTSLSEKVIKDLKSRFKNIYYLYDNDLTGIEMSTKFAKINNFKNIILVVKESTLDCKDVADFCKSIGLIKTKKLIENVKKRGNEYTKQC